MNFKNLSNQRHAFHLVTPSPWPFMASVGAFGTTFGGVLYMHSYRHGGFLLFFSFVLILAVCSVWWRDVIREATFEGSHTQVVQLGLRLGMLLFIVSEVMFFFAFFWAFFHSSLAPTVEIGSVWPPFGIVPFSPWQIPLLNTAILLLSGITITFTHHSIVTGDFEKAHVGFICTLALAVFFTLMQAYEYFPSTIFNL